MMLFRNLSNTMSLRAISSISGISLSSYYYRNTPRHVKRINDET